MKKRMFLSTILMTLVLLLAVTTATFAWYSASQATATLKGIDATQVQAGEDSYTLDGLTISAEFDGTDYADGKFADVELTDVNFDTYFLQNGTLVKVTDKQTKAFGTAKVVVTVKLGETVIAVNGAENDSLARYAGTYTVTVTGGGLVRVRNIAPEKSENGAAAVVTSFTITISDAGKLTTSLENDSLELPFWYLVSPAQTGTSVGDTVAEHANDKISVAITK